MLRPSYYTDDDEVSNSENDHEEEISKQNKTENHPSITSLLKKRKNPSDVDDKQLSSCKIPSKKGHLNDNQPTPLELKSQIDSTYSSAPLLYNSPVVNPTLYIHKIKEFLLQGYTIDASGNYIAPPQLTINQMMYDQQIEPVGSYAIPDFLLKDLRTNLLKNAGNNNKGNSSNIQRNVPIIYDNEDDDDYYDEEEKVEDSLSDNNSGKDVVDSSEEKKISSNNDDDDDDDSFGDDQDDDQDKKDESLSNHSDSSNNVESSGITKKFN